MTTFADPAPIPETAPPPAAQDPIGSSLQEWLRELIWTGASTQPRSLQKAAGMSEIGSDCDRELAYKIAGTPRSNFDSDPMASLVGTGIHLVLADIFRRLDAGTGRWMIEQPVDYRGIPGSADAYDRRRKLLIDWKSTSKSKLRNVRADGPPLRYIVQTQLYGQALKALGEDPQRLALVYLARDGGLTDLYVWTTHLDAGIADAAVTRYHDISARLQNKTPAEITPHPNRLCGWCDFHAPNSTDPARSCPGQNS